MKNPRRTHSARRLFLLAGLAAVSASLCLAQYRFGGGRGFSGGDNGPIIHTEGGIEVNEDTVRTARETASHSTGTPNWTNTASFEKDVFTFARVIFKRAEWARGYRSSWMGWLNDYPDSDLNLSYRLQQMTSLKVDPDGRVIRLTDKDIGDYPFIYMVKPGRMELRSEEVPALRKYLLNGGALMADDFWGEQEWENFESQIKRVFPERTWSELPMTHPLFQCVYPLKMPKNGLQVPPIHVFERTGSSSRNGEETRDMHVRAWFDDKQRIIIIATHNTDNGDGWEREGEESEYFHIFSETRAYPLAINIVFYLMTH